MMSQYVPSNNPQRTVLVKIQFGTNGWFIFPLHCARMLLSEDHRGMRFINCISHQVDAEVFSPRCLSITVGWLNQYVAIQFHVYFLCAKAEYIPLLYSRLLFACSAQKPQSKQTLMGGLTSHGIALAAGKNVGSVYKSPSQWRHNGCDSISNHQPPDCLHKRLFRRRSKKTSRLRVTGLCAENSPGTDEFPAQMASNAENVSIWWRHHALCL